MESLNDEEKKTLRESQREWVKFKEKEINFASELYSKKDGTIWRLYPPGRMIELTEDRIEQLVGYLSDQRKKF